MDETVEKACMVSHPVASTNATARQTVYRYAVTAANQSVALPSIAHNGSAPGTNVRGWFAKVKCVSPAGTTDVQYAFSNGAQALLRNQVSTFAVPSAAAGATLGAGESFDGLIPKGVTHLNFFGSAAEGYLELFISETV